MVIPVSPFHPPLPFLQTHITPLTTPPTAQGHLSSLLSTHFTIPCTFTSTLLSALAKLNLDAIIDDVNDETLDPWAALLAAADLAPGPLSPFVEKEALLDKGLCMDGGLFEGSTGFVYGRVGLGSKEVGEVVESFGRMGWWP